MWTKFKYSKNLWFNISSSKKLVNEHKKYCNYLHVELIQVTAKFLHKLGIDTPILIVLRHTRATTLSLYYLIIYDIWLFAYRLYNKFKSI